MSKEKMDELLVRIAHVTDVLGNIHHLVGWISCVDDSEEGEPCTIAFSWPPGDSKDIPPRVTFLWQNVISVVRERVPVAKVLAEYIGWPDCISSLAPRVYVGNFKVPPGKYEMKED